MAESLLATEIPLRSVEILTLACQARKVLFCMPLFLVLYVPPALSQKGQPGEAVLPKDYLHIEYSCHAVFGFGTTERESERWKLYSSSRFLRCSNPQQSWRNSRTCHLLRRSPCTTYSYSVRS